MKKRNKKKRDGRKAKKVKKKVVSSVVEADELTGQPAKKKRKVDSSTNIVIKIGIKKTAQGNVYQMKTAPLQQQEKAKSISPKRKKLEEVRNKKKSKKKWKCG